VAACPPGQRQLLPTVPTPFDLALVGDLCLDLCVSDTSLEYAYRPHHRSHPGFSSPFWAYPGACDVSSAPRHDKHATALVDFDFFLPLTPPATTGTTPIPPFSLSFGC
jgi:hypothetical protein